MFFKKRAFGLDISDSSIEALSLSSMTKVEKFGRVILDSDIVKDGIILDRDKFVESMKRLLSKSQIKSKRVILSLPESKSFIHVFKNFKDIEKEADNIIPLKRDERYSDHYKIGNSVLYVAATREIINSYVELLKEVGLEPIVIEPESIALARALYQKKKKNILIIDIGARTTNISAIDSTGAFMGSRIIKKAGNDFTEAISKKLKISLQEAEELKRKYGMDKNKEMGKVMFIIQNQLQPILEKSKELIEYYRQEVSQIYLAGGSSQMPKIVDYFSSNFDIETSVGVSELAVQIGRKSVLFNTVIGLAIRGLNRKAGINLLLKKGTD